MAGVDVGGGKGKRRSLDSDINMIPMIDLLMVTISFLLITAVWVQNQRLEANAQVPGPVTDTPPCGNDCKEDAKLHVETSDPAKIVLAWKTGRTVVRTVDVPRETAKKTGGVALPNLASKIGEEWKSSGVHREAADRQFDRAVVHAANDMPYSELIAIMDAVAQPKRQFARGSKLLETPAFDVTFATD
jgi:biopolymer transport protein ExbD